MKTTLQTFVRGGIPVVSPVNLLPEREPAGPGPINLKRVLFGTVITSVCASAIGLVVFKLIMTEIDWEAAGVWTIGIPVLGALIVVLVAWKVPKGAQVLLQPLMVLIATGTGAPLGHEGAVMSMGRMLRDGMRKGSPVKKEREIIAVAGLTAGMAALFGSPIAALLLMLELLMVDFALTSILPLALGAGIGGGLHILLNGTAPLFNIQQLPVAGIMSLPGYAVTGIIVGLVAVLAKLMMKGIRSLTTGFSWWPLIAVAVIVGITGYYFPEVLGAGYWHINELLEGKVTLQFLVVLGFVKLILWAVAMGTGTHGGAVAPLLVTGGALGVLITFIMQIILPSVPLHFAVAALAGMAAMFAGGMRVLPAAVILILETTHEPNALLPVICACTASYLVVFVLAKKKVTQPRTDMLPD